MTQDSSYATAPLTTTAVQLSTNLHLPEWDQAFASNRASPATAVHAFSNTLLDTVPEDNIWVDPLQHFAASTADSDLFAAFMPQSVSKASAVKGSGAVRNSASNSRRPALPQLQTTVSVKASDGTSQAELGSTAGAIRLDMTALQSGYDHPGYEHALIDSHADNGSSWGRHAAVQQTQHPAGDSSQHTHGFVDVDLWAPFEQAPASCEVAVAALAVSGDKASDNERLSGPHAEQLSSPAVATTHLSPLPHLHNVSKGGSLRQDALHQAHSSRHVGSGQHNSTFSPSSRTSSSNKGAASLQGDKAVQSSSLAGGLADCHGTFQAWESRGGGIKAVKLHQGSIVATEGTQKGSRPLPAHLLDQDATGRALTLQQAGASSSEGTQIGSRQLLLPLDQDATTSPDGAVGSSDLDGFPTAVAHPTDAQTDSRRMAPSSGYSAQLWQKASNRAMEGYTAAKQAVQEHSVSTGAISLQHRGARLARTISDKARPALNDVAAKTAAVGSSILEQAAVVVDSAGILTDAERQLQPTAAEMKYALGDVFGLSQERVDAVAEAGSRSLASWGVTRWRSWASQAE